MDKIMIFAKNLNRELLSKNIKQNDLAQKLGCTPQTVSDYIKYGRTNGKGGKKPSLENVLRIAEILNCSLDVLFGINGNTDSKLKISSYSDIVFAIEEILNFDECASIEIITSKAYDYPYTVYANLRTNNDILTTFFDKQQKMRSLLSDGTLSKEIYDAWFEGEITKLKSKEASAFSGLWEEDGELPF